MEQTINRICIFVQADGRDGVVAVKVQYPDASKQMAMDLGNIRTFAMFLSVSRSLASSDALRCARTPCAL